MTDLKERWLKAVKHKKYDLHSCSMCGYPCGWSYEQGVLGYDNGCWCTSNPQGWHPVEESELDFYLEPSRGHIKNITEFCEAVERDYPIDGRLCPSINSLCKEANETAIARGQNEGRRIYPPERELFMRGRFVGAIYRELKEFSDECMKARDWVVERAIEELADIVITCFSMAGFYGWDLEKAILDKMVVNKQRAERGE